MSSPSEQPPAPARGTRRIARISALVGLSTVGTALSGLIRSKLLALYVGPEGVGIYGQLAGLQQVCAIATSFGLTVALVRALAARRAAGWGEEAAREVGQVGAVQLVFVSIAMAAAIVGAAPIARGALGEPSLAWGVRVAALGVPGTLLLQLLQNVALAGGHVRRYVVVALIDAGTQVVAAVTLVVKLRMTGAVIYLGAGPLLSATLALVGYGRMVPLGSARQLLARLWRPDRKILLGLGAFGITIAVSYFSRQGSVTVVRTLLIRGLGTFSAGLFQAAYALSTYYANFFNQPLQNVAYPELATYPDPAASHPEYRRWLNLVVTAVPIALLLYVGALPVVLPLLNSRRFVGAIPVAAWQATGDFAFQVLQLNRMHLFAHHRILRALGLELVLDASLILATHFVGLPRFGVVGVSIAWTCAATAVMTGSTFVYGRRESLRMLARTAPRIALMAAAAVAMGRRPALGSAVALGGALLLGVLALGQRRQVAELVARIRRRTRRVE